MTKSFRRAQKGFTLIELLTVIAIIGILAAIVIPTVGAVKKSAQKAVDLSNLKQIGQACQIYAADNKDAFPKPDQAGRSITGGNAYLQWYGQLAKYANFNDPALVISKLDGAIDQTDVPPTILDPSANVNTPTLLAAFVSLDTTSFNVVSGLKSSDSSTSVLAYTRGLTTTGTWNATAATDDSPDRGVYADDGGHILFVGGNVQFFSNTTNALIANTGKQTSNVRQAVPNRSSVVLLGADSANSTASVSGVAALAGP